MKRFLWLAFLVLVSHSFTIEGNKQTYSVSATSGCTKDQKDVVDIAIAICPNVTLKDTALCVAGYISYNTYYKEDWNVFVKNDSTISDTVTFWFYFGCYLTLNNVGKYNRTYILWPTEEYWPSNREQQALQSLDEHSVNNKKPSTKKHQTKESYFTFNDPLTQKDYSLTQFQDACPSWKISATQLAMQLCDIPGNDHAADCIKNRIKNSLYEYWNVYVATSTDSFGKYWVFDSCSTRVQQFGAYNRTIVAWLGY